MLPAHIMLLEAHNGAPQLLYELTALVSARLTELFERAAYGTGLAEELTSVLLAPAVQERVQRVQKSLSKECNDL